MHYMYALLDNFPIIFQLIFMAEIIQTKCFLQIVYYPTQPTWILIKVHFVVQ